MSSIRNTTVAKAKDESRFRHIADVRLEAVVVNGVELPASPPESEGSPAVPTLPAVQPVAPR